MYLLETLPLSERKRDYNTEKINETRQSFNAIEKNCQKFLLHLANILSMTSKVQRRHVDKNICDIFDGRLFFHTLEILVNESNEDEHDDEIFTLENVLKMCNKKDLFVSLFDGVEISEGIYLLLT